MELEMTKDTKRALEIIKPMADELGIQVKANRFYLYCDDQAICIGYNSTYATVMEFIGYVIIYWAKKKDVGVARPMLDRIKRYWYVEE